LIALNKKLQVFNLNFYILLTHHNPKLLSQSFITPTNAQ